MASFGKSTIALPVLILGKLSLLACWVYFFLSITDVTSANNNIYLRIAAFVLGAAGIILVVSGTVRLGKEISVGIPDEKTTLKTTGIFSLTRNPVYVGSHLLCVASFILTINYLNLILLILAVVIHHFIILKEEEFLSSSFSEQWEIYKKNTPRYLLIK
jgi:protein-S-isoprenylcysteine O-methyltransferase Ste14